METRGSSRDDISGWLTPRQALEILESVFPDKHSALYELRERLRGGIVVAVCRYTTVDGVKFKQGVLNRLGAEDWENVRADDDVWISGTLTIPGGYRASLRYDSPKTIRFFEVRFNPAQLNEIIAITSQRRRSRPQNLR